MNWRIATVFPLLLMLTGCAKKLPEASLGVDVYLHPEAASVDDILLQAAIQKKIGDSLPGRAGLVTSRMAESRSRWGASITPASEQRHPSIPPG